MAAVREAPAAFVAELKRRFGSDHDVRFNTAVQRWEFVSNSAAGLPVSQFWGWYRNPVTGAPIEADAHGLVPFRDLDATAQAEILANLEASFIGNRHDGSRDWKQHVQKASAFNQELTRSRTRQQAEIIADLIAEMDLRRPWVKHHTGPRRARAVAYGSLGVRQAAAARRGGRWHSR